MMEDKRMEEKTNQLMRLIFIVSFMMGGDF